MHWSASTIATICVAAFTGTTMVIAGLAYHHGKALTGWSNPIRKKVARSLDTVEYHPELLLREPRPFERSAAIFLFNHADVEQTLRLDTDRSRVIWPRVKKVRIGLATRGFLVESHKGGMVFIDIFSSTGAWPKGERHKKAPLWWRGHYWLWLISSTTSGHRGKRLIRLAVKYDDSPTPPGA